MTSYSAIQSLPPGSIPAGAVLRAVFVADQHRLDRLELIRAVAMDFTGKSRRKIFRFANRLHEGDDLPTAMAEAGGLFEPSWSLAIRLAGPGRSEDCMGMLIRRQDEAIDTAVVTSVDRHILSHSLRAAFTFSAAVMLSSFVAALIFPTLLQMQAEFDVQQTTLFTRIIEAFDIFWPYKYIATFVVLLFVLLRLPTIIRSLLTKLNPMLPTYGRRQADADLLALLALATTSPAPMVDSLRLLSRHHPRPLVARSLKNAAEAWREEDQPKSWRMLGKRRILLSGETRALVLAGSDQTRAYLLQQFSLARSNRRRSRRWVKLRSVESILLVTSAIIAAAIAIAVFESLSVFVKQTAVP